MRKEKFLNCNAIKCNKKIVIGEDFCYDKNYNAFCNNRECTDNIAVSLTVLEPCWF